MKYAKDSKNRVFWEKKKILLYREITERLRIGRRVPNSQLKVRAPQL